MPLIEAHELYRFYHNGDDETAALRGVSLCVGHGEIVAITGPSGSGKSTLLSCLTGLEEPDGGYVIIAGERITRRSEAFRASIRATRFGILQQVPNLLEHLTVTENIELQMHLAGIANTSSIEVLLSTVDLLHRAYGYPNELSGGEAARAGLAVALATDPVLLVADEPTAEVDRKAELHLIEHFKDRRQAGKSTLVATHSDAVSDIADRVLKLRDGKVVHD